MYKYKEKSTKVIIRESLETGTAIKNHRDPLVICCEIADIRDCDFYVTISEMSKFQNLKNRIKSERSNIFENGPMRKVAQILRNMRKQFQKIFYFLLPFTFTVHEKNLGKLFQK